MVWRGNSEEILLIVGWGLQLQPVVGMVVAEITWLASRGQLMLMETAEDGGGDERKPYEEDECAAGGAGLDCHLCRVDRVMGLEDRHRRPEHDKRGKRPSPVACGGGDGHADGSGQATAATAAEQHIGSAHEGSLAPVSERLV